MRCGYKWEAEFSPGQPHVCGLDENHWPEDHKCSLMTGKKNEFGQWLRCGETTSEGT